MNLSVKEKHAKRRKRNIIAKRLREDRQYGQRVVKDRKNNYNRQEWKHETDTND